MLDLSVIIQEEIDELTTKTDDKMLKRFSDHFTWERIAEKYLNIIMNGRKEFD